MKLVLAEDEQDGHRELLGREQRIGASLPVTLVLIEGFEEADDKGLGWRKAVGCKGDFECAIDGKAGLPGDGCKERDFNAR